MKCLWFDLQVKLFIRIFLLRVGWEQLQGVLKEDKRRTTAPHVRLEGKLVVLTLTVQLFFNSL